LTLVALQGVRESMYILLVDGDPTLHQLLREKGKCMCPHPCREILLGFKVA
jgi:hypothetical protein